MPDSLIVGSFVGAIIGLLHARSVYAARAREVSKGAAASKSIARGRAAYFALWTFLLWVVFGSYVFYLWVASVIIYGVYLLFKRQSPLRAGL